MENTEKQIPFAEEKSPNNSLKVFKFIVYSLIGIFTFFIPITINDSSTIPLDHLVTYVQQSVPAALPY